MDSLSPALALGRVVEAEVSDEGLKARLQRLDRPQGIETDWLPISSPMAGPETGFAFTPEIDDLAVLGFVGKKGIILGFIYGGGSTPPSAAAEERRISSRDGNSLTLVDGDSSGITIIDKNGNEIILDADGITINAAGDFKVQAEGDIKLEASGTTTVIGATVELNP